MVQANFDLIFPEKSYSRTGHFKAFIVVVHRHKIRKIVSLSKYLWPNCEYKVAKNIQQL